MTVLYKILFWGRGVRDLSGAQGALGTPGDTWLMLMPCARLQGSQHYCADAWGIPDNVGAPAALYFGCSGGCVVLGLGA